MGLNPHEVVGKKVWWYARPGVLYTVIAARSPRCGETDWLFDIRRADGEVFSVYGCEFTACEIT